MSARRLALALAAAACALGALTATGPTPAGRAASPPPRLSFTEVQQQFMCTICHEPLNVAGSPEAMQEDSVLRTLIARGDTMAQIKHEMVVQWGVAVLAVPPASGFSLLVFVIPGVIIVLGLLVLAYTIPRWRRRAAVDPSDPASPASISDADAQRLDADLARGR